MTALAGTIIIHLIALMLLYLGVIRAFAPLGDGGVPVAFGDYTAVAGIYQPPSAAVTQPRPTQPQPARTQPQPQPRQRQNQTRQPTTRPATQPSGETVITQAREETVSVPENTNNTNTAIAEANARREREENERRQREAEELKQQEEKDNLASRIFSGSNTQENNQGGVTTGTSNPGNPFGDHNTRSTEGSGGISSRYNLGGRSLLGSGQLPEPCYPSQIEGTIVLNIVVDPNGNVISAEVGRGTNIPEDSMRKCAEKAAKSAKFNKAPGANNQSGTVTYNYKFKVN